MDLRDPRPNGLERVPKPTTIMLGLSPIQNIRLGKPVFLTELTNFLSRTCRNGNEFLLNM